MTVQIKDAPYPQFVRLLETYDACVPAQATVNDWRHQFSAREAWNWAYEHQRSGWMFWGLMMLVDHSTRLTLSEKSKLKSDVIRASRARNRRWKLRDKAAGFDSEKPLMFADIEKIEGWYARVSERIERMYLDALYSLIEWR